MSANLDYLDDIGSVIDRIAELSTLMSEGNFEYQYGELAYSYRLMFDRFCPFKLGDTVRLIETPDISLGHGWYCYRERLVKGAIATVRTRSYSTTNNWFSFSVKFEFAPGVFEFSEYKLELNQTK